MDTHIKSGLGHQFKAKARTYQAIANDLKDVCRERLMGAKNPFEIFILRQIEEIREQLEEAAGRELDSFNDRS